MNQHVFTSFSIALLCVCLAACSGGSGESNRELAGEVDTVTDDTSGVVYKGLVPAATEDVRNYSAEVWSVLADEAVCGSCHVEGGQSPQFVRGDDINLAYASANDLVDLTAPSTSRLVTKVFGDGQSGHNCWLSSLAACATTITNLITNWANASGAEAAEIVLTPPLTIVDPDASRSFPAAEPEGDGLARYNSGLYASLQEHCGTCHSDTGSLQQQKPFFASDDLALAYEEAKTKISLSDAAILLDESNAAKSTLTAQDVAATKSRLITRLRDESHNCWGEGAGPIDCDYSATETAGHIAAFFNGLDAVEVDSSLVTSKALRLRPGDAIVASSGGRYQSDAIALYQFDEGEGNTAFDTSGVSPAVNLELDGNIDFLSSWGIRIGAAIPELSLSSGKAQALTSDSRKIHDLITATGEYSIEAWVAPLNVTQDNSSRIVTYSASSEARNFTLGQTLYNYDFLTRSSLSDANGMPALSTPDAAEVLQATLQHVVVNFDPNYGRSIFVNGELVAPLEFPEDQGGEIATINNWDSSFALVIGNEVNGQELWQGVVRYLAIHNRTLAFMDEDEGGEPFLNAERVIKNYEVGVGQKYFLLFDVSEHVGMPDAFVAFNVEVFDDYSYLFSNPFFVGLDADARPTDDIIIKGVRIGMNGQEVQVGQSFANIDNSQNPISATDYTPDTPYPLASIGTIIAKERGSDNGTDEDDQFFLIFDEIGVRGNTAMTARQAEPEASPLSVVGSDGKADIGVRDFAEVNASIAAMTSVPLTTGNLNPASEAEMRGNPVYTYDLVRRQLPVSPNIQGFSAAHQAGIAQLAVAYCTALVNDNQRRSAFFRDELDTSFDFNRTYAQAFPADNSLIIDPLMSSILANGIGDDQTLLQAQPDPTATASYLSDLITAMNPALSGKTDSAEVLEAVVVATCAAAVGSAAMLMQ